MKIDLYVPILNIETGHYEVAYLDTPIPAYDEPVPVDYHPDNRQIRPDPKNLSLSFDWNNGSKKATITAIHIEDHSTKTEETDTYPDMTSAIVSELIIPLMNSTFEITVDDPMTNRVIKTINYMQQENMISQAELEPFIQRLMNNFIEMLNSNPTRLEPLLSSITAAYRENKTTMFRKEGIDKKIELMYQAIGRSYKIPSNMSGLIKFYIRSYIENPNTHHEDFSKETCDALSIHGMNNQLKEQLIAIKNQPIPIPNEKLLISDQQLAYILCCQCLKQAMKMDQDKPFDNVSIAYFSGIPLDIFNKAEIALMKFDGLLEFGPRAATESLQMTSYHPAGSSSSSSESGMRPRQTVSNESANADVDKPQNTGNTKDPRV